MLKIEVDTTISDKYQFDTNIKTAIITTITAEPKDNMAACIRFIERNGGHDSMNTLYTSEYVEASNPSNVIHPNVKVDNCQNIVISVFSSSQSKSAKFFIYYES